MNHRRILFVTGAGLTDASGQSIKAYARRLAARGNSVCILYHGAKPARRADYANYQVLPAEYQGVLLSRATKRTLKEFDPQIIHAFGRWTRSLSCALEAVVLSNAALIVHIEDDEVFYHRTYDALDSTRSAWDEYDSIVSDKWSPEASERMLRDVKWSRYFAGKLARPVDPALFHVAMYSARGFTVIWRHMFDSISRFSGGGTMVLPPGHEGDFGAIDPDEAHQWLTSRLGVPNDTILIGHSGSIRHISDEFSMVVQAFARVVEDVGGARMVLWGRDWQRCETGALIERFGLEERVHQLGWIESDEEHLRMVAGVDLHVCAGLNNRFNRWRLPSRLCQCLASGRPIVVWQEGFGESLTDGEDALLVGEDETQAWAGQLLRLATDKSLRRRIGLRAKERAGEWFNMERLTNDLEEFYDRILRQHTDSWSQGGREAKTVPTESLLPEYVRTKWDLLGNQYGRVAIYGQGHHTAWMRSVLGSRFDVKVSEGSEPPVVTCLLDDHPAEEGVSRPESVNAEAFDAVVLSSDTFQDKMRRRCQAVFGVEMPVVDLYEGLPPGPYAKVLERAGQDGKECSYAFESVGPWLNGINASAAVEGLEILSVELLDRKREIVRAFLRLGKLLEIGIGWHYLLDFAWTVSHLPISPPGKVLDAGSGNGLMQYYLARAGFDVISIDRLRVRANSVCCGFIDRSQGSLHRITGDLRNLDMFASQSIDAVVSISALEHNEPPSLRECVHELLRVLRPGAALLATLGAARDADWYHEQSHGWNYTEKTLANVFDLGEDTASNYERFDECMEQLQNCQELRTGLADFYYSSGANGMPWGWWNPQYQPVGVCKIKP